MRAGWVADLEVGVVNDGLGAVFGTVADAGVELRLGLPDKKLLRLDVDEPVPVGLAVEKELRVGRLAVDGERGAALTLLRADGDTLGRLTAAEAELRLERSAPEELVKRLESALRSRPTAKLILRNMSVITISSVLIVILFMISSFPLFILLEPSFICYNCKPLRKKNSTVK